MRFETHENHVNMLKEFYSSNKYILTEQMKDTILDAVDCMEVQIPIQPTVKREELYNGYMDFVELRTSYSCPKCGNIVVPKLNCTDIECGQKINWSQIDENF